MGNSHLINKENNQLPEEEYYHYSGLPSVQFYENIEKEKVMQEKESKTNWHFRISLAKSFLRIIAGGVLCGELFLIAGILLIAAEVLGIVEEF
jgi:hypothetical protein